MWSSQVQRRRQASRAGVTAGSVDIAARKVIKENGYGQYFNNRVGHGLGKEVHEEPSMHEKNETILELGFCLQLNQAFISLDMAEYELKRMFILEKMERLRY